MENINPNETQSQSQCGMILKHLQSGGTITQLEAYKKFNCTRLGARIYDLKQRGYLIQRRMITVPSGKCVAEYSLVV